MTLPESVAELLGRPVVPGTPAQALPFLTVDAVGFPHVALLSAVELAMGADGSVHAVLAGPTTRANVLRTKRATLLAVEGTTAHTVKLILRRSVELEDVLGAVLDVAVHNADSLGLDLAPITFLPTQELAEIERWDRTARVLASLEDPLGR